MVKPEIFDRFVWVGLVTIILVGAVTMVFLIPALGWYAPFGYLSFNSINIHVYDVMLYPAFTLIVLRRIWGVRAFGALLFLWGVNEWTFNLLYKANWIIFSLHYLPGDGYLFLMAGFLVGGVALMAPKVHVNALSGAWPLFLALWVSVGEPIIFSARPDVLPAFTNWPWEVVYQFMLFITFLTTFRPPDP